MVPVSAISSLAAGITPRRLWLEWVAACAACGVMTVGAGLLIGPWAIPAIGLLGGTAQWIVLRRHVPRVGWAWVPATAVGAPLALALVWVGFALVGLVLFQLRAQWLGPFFFGSTALPVLLTTGSLAVVGQWLVLRRSFDGAGWWLSGGAAAGPAIGDMLPLVLRAHVVGRLDMSHAPYSPVFGALAEATAHGAVYGAITGFVLIWLVCRPAVPATPGASVPLVGGQDSATPSAPDQLL
jgi:hypothetical protein